MKSLYLLMRQLCRMANSFVRPAPFRRDAIKGNGKLIPMAATHNREIPVTWHTGKLNTTLINPEPTIIHDDAAFDNLQHRFFCCHLPLTAPINIDL